MTAGRLDIERFARATDALISGLTPPATDAADVAGELGLAVLLRESAGQGIADPAFVESLRSELQARIAARVADSTAQVRYSLVETPLGRLALAYRNGRVVSCTAVRSEREAEATGPVPAFEREVARELGVRPEYEPAPPPSLARAVRDHLAGKRRFTDVDISWLTPFHQRVLQKTAEIPRGEVRPYGWIAREIGSPGATRAVGTALGHNPIPFLIPCHRVVRSDGSLGEYSGGGPTVKVRVLELEGAPVTEILHPGAARYRGSRTTHIVCYPTCHAARRIREENIVPFRTLAEADAYGFRPCQRCRPA